MSVLHPCRAAARRAQLLFSRTLSTLQSNPHIYVFPNPQSLDASHLLTLLSSEPPIPDLAIGTTTKLPPTSDSFSENPKFLSILQGVLAQYAHNDPQVISQAQVMASQAGSSLGSGGVFFPQQWAKEQRGATGGGGAGGASAQGGAGGGGVGGWVHVSDARNPPDYGRIAWPEDIFGSVEVDGSGHFVDGHGRYQPSGTYRIITREGM